MVFISSLSEIIIKHIIMKIIIIKIRIINIIVLLILELIGVVMHQVNNINNKRKEIETIG